jgi:hypothetical protein
MQTYAAIKHFIQETLGCSCPEEVFRKIDYQKACKDISGSKVNVGDRLLVYIITLDDKPDKQEVIRSALQRGIEERDNKGLNRFRLVLVTSRPDELHRLAEQAFDDSGYASEKTHLHVVNESDVGRF